MAAFVASIYDPKLGQDFRAVDTYTGDMLSGLAESVFAIDCVGEVSWADQIALLSELMLKTSKLGFFATTPWFPGSKRLRRLLAADFPMNEVTRGLLVGYFSPNAERLARLFDIRSRGGGNSSGEMLLGGCTEPLDLSGVTVPGGGEPWALAISQRSRIGCFLYLGELQRSTLLTRMSSGTADPLEQLAARLMTASKSSV